MGACSHFHRCIVNNSGLRFKSILFTVKSLKVIEEIETELMAAWEYHFKYAKSGEYDYGCYYAFDDIKLYTPEEWAAIKGSMG